MSTFTKPKSKDYAKKRNMMQNNWKAEDRAKRTRLNEGDGIIPLNEDDEPAMKHAEDPSLTIKCYVDCPYCGAFLDLMDQKDSGLDWESQPRPHEDTTDLDLHVECGECKKEFIVDAITY